MSYQRTAPIRTRQGEAGFIEGTLATNGEASDGHILEVAGIEVPDGTVPLLFGHDAHSGRNNLGSWTGFQVMGAKQRARQLGDAQLHGAAQIELGGSGSQAEFRQDVHHMIESGHINAFSVRWDPVGEPVYRSSLPKDHYAYRDEGGGLYFEQSRILEGSVVTIGADQSAVVARALESEGREWWLRVLGPEMFAEQSNRIEDLNGRVAVLEGPPPDIEVVSGNVIPAAVPEDSAPSIPREPESRPAQVSQERWLELFEKRLDYHTERATKRREAVLRRIVG